jgi:hypothetical protein
LWAFFRFFLSLLFLFSPILWGWGEFNSFAAD